MDLLKSTIAKVTPLNDLAMAKIKKASHNLITPEGCLGYLETILQKYVGITNEITPSVPKKCMVVACADHGVAEEGVSAYPVETTVQMTRNYLVAKGAGANAMALHCGADLVVVDVGIAAPMEKIEGLIDRKINYGTKNFTKGPAMTESEAIRSLEIGIEIATQKIAEGYRCFCLGEMGIANTTSSAAIVAAFAKLAPKKATGRGTNISDERLLKKIQVVEKGLAVNKPNSNDGLDVLKKVGGFELGCLAGVILGCAANRAAVVIDGFNASAAALIAASLCPLSKKFLIGSHLSAEPAHSKALEILELKAYIDMHFRFGEATGAALAMSILDATIKSYLHESNPENTTIIDPDQMLSEILPDRYIAASLDNEAMQACQLHIDNLTKPLGSLGHLEKLAVQLAGITEMSKPKNFKKSILLFSTPKNSLIYAFASHTKANLTIADLDNSKMNCGQALALGMQVADQEFKKGSRILGIGESLNLTPYGQQVPNRFANKSLESFTNIDNVELAAITGAIIAAAANKCAIMLDGPLTALAARIAVSMNKEINNYLINASLSPEPLHKEAIESLNLNAYLYLDSTLYEGCQAALGMTLLDACLHMVNDMKTFKQAAVAIANDGPGANRQSLDI